MNVDIAGKCQGALHCHSLRAFDGKDVIAIIGAIIALVVIVKFFRWMRS